MTDHTPAALVGNRHIPNLRGEAVEISYRVQCLVNMLDAFDAAINGPAACSVTAPDGATTSSRTGQGAGSGAAPIEGLADAIASAESSLRVAHAGDWAAVLTGVEDMRDILAAARAYQEAAAELAEMKRDRAARNKIDPTTRLHNICDALAESRRDSPYDEASWKLDAERWRRLMSMPVGGVITLLQRSRDLLGSGPGAFTRVIDAAIASEASPARVVEGDAEQMK